MGTHSTVLVKTDASPETVAGTIAATYDGNIKSENTEFGRTLWLDDFSITVVKNDFEDDGDIKFSYYNVAIIIASRSNDHNAHRSECLSMGRNILGIVTYQMNSPCLLVMGVQELVESFPP